MHSSRLQQTRSKAKHRQYITVSRASIAYHQLIPDCRFSSEISMNRIAKNLSDIQKYHNSLHTLCDSLQSIYSLQLLMTILEIFLNYICTIFFWVHIVVKKDYSYKVARSEYYFPYAVSLMVIHTAQLMCLVVFSSKTADEVKLHF